MAANPMPDQSQQGAPQQGGAPQDSASQQQAASQAPASPQLMTLAKLYSVLQQLSQSPDFAIGVEGLKAAMQGINQAQAAMVSQPQQSSPNQNPPQ